MLRLVNERIHDSLFFRPRQFVYSGSMSTAMVRIYTPDGFVIAADGYPSLNAQKIFPASGSSYSLAYGLVGWADVSEDEKGWRVSWAEESQGIATRLAEMSFGKMEDYVSMFTRMLESQVRDKILHLKAKDEISEEDYTNQLQGAKESSLHFAGYFDGIPKMVTSHIHFDLPRSSASLSLGPETCAPYLHYLYGSQGIRELISTPTEPVPIDGEAAEVQDARRHIWQRYRTRNLASLIHRHDITYSEAIEAARDYIEACKDPEAKKIDYKACLEIAGKIHIAKVTESGFEWVDPPLCA